MNDRPVAWWHGLLLIVILLGFLLRVGGLGQQSLWYDEGVTAVVSQQGTAELTRWTANDIQPPLYYLLLSPWTRVMGTSEWALRFPSVMAGVLGLALLYALGRRVWQRKPLMAVLAPASRPVPIMDRDDNPAVDSAAASAPSAWVLPVVPWLVVLLAAVAPQWVYYAQEARNYTLLTSLGMLAAYLLLRIIGTAASRPRRYLWAAFVAAALAALYTHYFALFVLAALALYYAIAWWVDRPQRHWRSVEGLLAAAAILAGYLPWLPFLLNRYQVDTSYWQGTLKLDEALRHLAINSTMGAPEMLLEPVAVGLLLVWAGVFFAALLGIRTALRRPTAPHDAGLRLLFVLLYLLIPVGCVLALAISTPKFNPRYTMLATPALFLLLGLGLGQPRPPAHRRIPYPQLAVLAVVATSAIALYNWYQDPAYAKADWRGVAQYVRTHATTGDAVVLVSGHAAPVWDYYAPDLPAVRLPAIDVLDVNQVLGYDAASTLQAGLAGKSGAWLVSWQDDVVDPVGFAADLLGRTGREEALPRQFAHVGLRYFHLPPAARFRAEPPAQHPIQANFDGLVELTGWGLEPCATPPCPLRLEWRALQPALPDLKLAGEVVDTDGRVWAQVPDQRLAGYEYPTTRWMSQRPVFGRITLPWWQGTPPGTYDLNLRVYAEGESYARDVLDAAGNPQGQSVRLAGIELDQAVIAGPAGPPPPAGAVVGAPAPPIDLGDDITVSDYWLAPTVAEAGQPLNLVVRYQIAQPPTDGALSLSWVAPNGQTAASVQTTLPELPAGSLPSIGLAQLTPRVPVTATPGIWNLQLAWGRDPAVPAGDVVRVPVQVTPAQRAFELPEFDRPLAANFADELLLAGALIPTPTGVPAASLPVTVVWQTLKPPARDLTGFVQLLDASGRLVAQAADRPPAARPTTGWLPGEVVSSTYTLALPGDLAPGRYQVIAGLYDPQAAGMPRLRVVPGGNDHVVLGELTIP